MAIPTTVDTNNFLEWRNNTNTVANSVGDLTTLTTTEKASLVGAVNEIGAYFIGGWAGSTDIITLGTITTGTWNATAIADNKISSTLTGKTYNSLTLTANAVGWTVGGGTTGVSVSFLGGAAYTFSGTNGQTYTLPASGGTLAKNNQSFYIGTTSIPINAGTGSITNIAGLTSITATSFVGNASTASVASTANGWTTGRTITIGSTGKTVDGTANVSWSLGEMGAPELGAANTWTAVQTFKHVNYPTEYNNGSVTGAVAIDWSNGQQQKLTMTGNITALTFSFAGLGAGFYQLKVIQNNSSAYTIAWSTNTPQDARWLNNPAAPSLFTGSAGRTTMFNFFWDGTLCYGSGAKVDSY